MAIVNKKGRQVFWQDPDGFDVPIKYVPEHEQKRDKLVTDVFERVEKARLALAEAKKDCVQAVNKFLDDTAENYSEKWQGNATLYDFSQQRQIAVRINKKLEFDERLKLAKRKIDSYISGLVKGQAKQLITLVNDVFRIDKKGKVDARQILQLKKYDFDADEWVEAMKIIDESLTIAGTKTYYQFYERDSEGTWKSINLNFNSLNAG